MNAILEAWNQADAHSATEAMLACCGAKRWAVAMTAARPLSTQQALYAAADEIWSQMTESDWLEAFVCHPRIGERKAAHASQQSAAWSQQEQSSTTSASQEILDAIAQANLQYEKLFGFTYIVCATGKSSEEMLAILQRRLHNDRATELREAAEQQRQIMHIRLTKWLEL